MCALMPHDTLLHYYNHKDQHLYVHCLNQICSPKPFLNQEHADTETYCHT